MASETLTTLPRTDSAPAAPGGRFVNGMRLNARHWLAVAGVLAIVLMCTPRIWKKIERFDNNSDYRMPYPLSKDY